MAVRSAPTRTRPGPAAVARTETAISRDSRADFGVRRWSWLSRRSGPARRRAGSRSGHCRRASASPGVGAVPTRRGWTRSADCRRDAGTSGIGAAPTRKGSALSTDCRGVTNSAGDEAAPTRRGWTRSADCRRDAASAGDEAAPTRGDRSCQQIVGEMQPFQAMELPQLGGIGPVNRLSGRCSLSRR